MSLLYWLPQAFYLALLAGIIWTVIKYLFRAREIEIQRRHREAWISRALEIRPEEGLCNPPDGYCYYNDDPCSHFLCTGKGDIIIPGLWFYEEDPELVQ